jgi:hypothetical protein
MLVDVQSAFSQGAVQIGQVLLLNLPLGLGLNIASHARMGQGRSLPAQAALQHPGSQRTQEQQRQQQTDPRR